FLDIDSRVYELAKPPPAPHKLEADQVKEPSPLRYQSNHPLDELFPNWASKQVNEAIVRRRLEMASVPAGTVETVKSILAPVRLDSKDLTRKNPETGKIEEAPDENKFVSMMAPFGLLMLMFMAVMVGATPLMQGVVEEKMQRIAEVLLGSVSPFQLMLGKLLGTVSISLTLICVYLGGAYLAAQKYGYAQHLPGEIVAWFVVF